MNRPLALSSCVCVVGVLVAGCGAYAKRAEPVGSAAAQAPYSSPPPAQAIAKREALAEAPSGGESFKDYGVNPFVDARKDRLSTFSIDVDTASYSFARRRLRDDGAMPPPASVRTEEFLNSFDYGYAAPDAKAPFSVHFAAAPSPFAAGHHLVRVGVQTKRISREERKPVHLVYLVDTSGSMSSPDKLPLAKKSLALLTETLKPGDTVALCTYAGDTRIVLEPTGIEDKAKILAGISKLEAGGGTAMASGVELAYGLASKTLVKGHVNRVVVLSDGDANIGKTGPEDLLRSIARYKERGITLSTVGFGNGNYKDVMMEQLADKGDGNYTYIDGEPEARKVFTEQVDGLLQVVARDVKIQVELDPDAVKRYRLIGYENRDIADKDFRNDKVDAGEVGAGHSVTALYDVELVTPGQPSKSPLVVRMRSKPAESASASGSATETSFAMPPSSFARTFEEAPANYRFAVAVAGFADVLRQSPHGVPSLADIERIAVGANDNRADRREFIALVKRTTELTSRPVALAR